MATIRDVSKLANVSISTVSRVINNTAQVAPQKREAVLKAMHELNFRPNSFAQALVSKRSNCIGVLVGDLCGGHFFAQMMSGIEQVVEGEDKYTVVVSGRHDRRRERHAIDILLQRQCDALILHTKALSDDELREIASVDTPVVIVNRQVEGLEDRCIWFDNYHGAELALSHLIQLGHRRIAFVTYDDDSFVDAQERLEGYKKTLDDYGIEFEPALVSRAFGDEIGGYIATSELLKRKVDFTALFCFNDSMLAGAISCLSERSIQIPEQLSVVGFDDIPYTRFFHPKLTTVRYPIAEMGACAAKLALCLLEEKPTDQFELCFKPELVCRESVSKQQVEVELDPV
ncbi:LacI family DNA-binding transcriptional regulator [Dongshaea marina]|uniref:LacI family DNA-binding transcriptional regulator n=1 Tax=Dongshaea marina TaxID=2047966 RepID=UPI000D3E0A0F|nr:LacI family DNA-binding transcriptional regulator [Dongshaea marina]